MDGPRIQSGDVEYITVFFQNVDGSPATGLTPKAIIRRADAPGLDYWDGVGSYLATPTSIPMTEVDAADSPGEYVYAWDTSAGSGVAAVEHVIKVEDDTGTAVNSPQFGTVYVGGYVDDVDAAVSSRATQADILSDATPFAGANVDAAVSSRAAPGDAMDLVTDAVDADALAASALTEIADAVWNALLATYQTAGTFGRTIIRILSHAAGRYRTVRGDPWTQEVYVPDDVATIGGSLEDVYDLKQFDGTDIADTGGQNPVDDPTIAIAERDEP